LLADLVPDLRQLLGIGGVEDVDVDDRDAWLGIALQIVEMRRLLELALDAVGDLLHHVEGRRARPVRLHDHCIDREGRVFLPPQPRVGTSTRSRTYDHKEDDERAMAQRPFGNVEAGHWPTPAGSETFC